MIVLFYFSGTGNTWWVSEELVNLLEKKEIAASAISIESIESREAQAMIEKADIVGFGYPIYGSDLPQPMKEFIMSLEAVNNKKCFVFCTQVSWSGDGARIGAEFLRPKGFDIRWGEEFLMPNNICVSALPFFSFTSDRKKIEDVLAKCSGQIERFAGHIVSGKPFRKGFSFLSFLLGCVQRVPFRIVYKSLQNDIKVNSELCTFCGFCAKVCPAGNLIFDGETFSTRGNCVLCMRCYNFCPVSAIKYMNRLHNADKGEPYRGPLETFSPDMLCGKR